MERIRLTDPAAPRFGEAFALYEISFPVYERRTRASQAARFGGRAWEPGRWPS